MEANLQTIKQALNGFSVENMTEASRKALLEDARSLVAALETPEDKLARLGWFEVRLPQPSSLCLSIELKLIFHRSIVRLR